MNSISLIDIFDCEVQCEYKNRKYLVRDNGSIFRLSKEDGRHSKWDNIWTFGTKNDKGYMVFTGNVCVHQIVCTAFHGQAPKPNMVVDHIDTNRCNNRPDNLRWLTKLENALMNEATRKKIIFLCGSIEAFLENPSILRDKVLPTNISWMRTVTKEEAVACKKHIAEWAARDSNTKSKGEGIGIGEWIYSLKSRYISKDQREAEIKKDWKRYIEENYGLKNSLTEGCKQLNWKTPTEFLQCPEINGELSLQKYLHNLTKDKFFCRSQYGEGSVVLDFDYCSNKDAIYVLAYNGKSVKPWAMCRITLEDGFYVHFNVGSFFREEDAIKYYSFTMGKSSDCGDAIYYL